MNFVQLCEELIREADLLEEAARALLSDSAITQLATDMKDFAGNFKKMLTSADESKYAAARQEQLKWRNRLRDHMSRALARSTNKLGKSSAKPLKLTWQQLDDHIMTVIDENRSLYAPFRLLLTANLGEPHREEIKSQ